LKSRAAAQKSATESVEAKSVPSTADLEMANVAHPTTVNVAHPTTVNVADPTTVNVAHPTTVKVADPTTVNVAHPTTVNVADPTTVNVAHPTTVNIAPTTANAADLTVVDVAADVDASIKESVLNYVELQKLKSEGQCSSGNSWIVDGLLTDIVTNTKTEVMVKLVEKDRIGKAENEFRMMNILYKDSTSNHDYFIAPLSPTLLHGSKGQIKGHGGDDCSKYVGIAMEKGIRNLKDRVQGGSNLSINGVKLEAEKLLHIIIAANQAKVVLMDFKLSNIVLVADHNGLHLKAIDFDCSCNVNGPISTDTSAFYSCPEVARWVVGGCLPSETPLASHKMDVMAYGFCVYEIATKVVYNGRSKSFWENGGVRSGQVHTDSVNMALASLTDEQVTANLEKTFVGSHYGNLRSFLQQALRVDPEARSSGVRLLNQSSFLGSIERTVDHRGLGAQVTKQQNSTLFLLYHFFNVFSLILLILQLNRIEMKVDGLSEQLRRGFDTVGTTLDTITARVVGHLMNGDPKGTKTSKGVAALSEALQAQKGKSGVDDDGLSKRITTIIEEQMSGMGDALCKDLKESLGNVLAKANIRDGNDQPSRDDKLDALLVMMKSMQEKMDGFTNDFKRFNEISLEHYSAASKGRNVMPSSFLLLPDVTVAVDASASLVNKMFNRARRLKDSVVNLGWNKVRVVFFCPVTLKIVKCGPYIVASPTKELRRVACALKWGILLAR
jgi:Protein kinase domain